MEKSEKETNTVVIDWHDRYLRMVAECDNQRKRHERQMTEQKRFGIYETVEKVVSPLYNDIVRGMLNEGEVCRMLFSNLNTNLKSIGVESIGWNINCCIFNDNEMEAVSVVKTDDPSKDGTVASLYEYGFKDIVSNKVIKHAKVVVYKYEEV